jgi:eukaryotic-like serine/threonine-protein kinase
MAATEGPYAPGATIAGRFDVEAIAGEGGMGVVYRCWDRLTAERAAVKVILGDVLDESGRFEREAQILSRLMHPGVVGYLEHGRTERGLYLAMEWLAGEDLGKRLQTTALSWADSVEIAQSVAGSLAAAHRLGVVHRDLKPSNLFLVDGSVQHVKVLDFGVARLLRDKRATATGVVLGTPAYMAPEQATGAHDVDERADFFALGVVLYECLTGQLPFAGDDPIAVLASILLAEAPRVSERYPDIPEALDDLVASMLAKNPDERPRSAPELQQALRNLRSFCPTVRPAPAEPVAAITDTEQRLVSLLCMRRDEHAPPSSGRLGLDEALAPYGARVHDLCDGTVVVVLTAADAATDLVTQAARCALVARQLLPSYRIAAATGRGQISGRLPVGDVLDSAFRVLATRERPGIALDAVTAGLLGEGFVIGRDDGGTTLIDEQRGLDSERLLLGKSSPCVGRARELAALAATFAECVEEPVARVAVVTGEAGVGKSRLRRELLAQVHARGEPVEVWIARGDPLGARSPFGLLAPALRRACGIRDGEPLALQQRRLRERVLSRMADSRETRRTIVLLGELMGVPCGAEAEDAVLLGDQMRRAWEDFVAAEVKARPLLIVLDDVQWGDRPSLQFIDAALRLCREAPLMVVAFARPEVKESFGELWEEHGALAIRLAGLTRKASEELVRSALGETIGDAEIALLVERAQGNAFFLEELIRAVAMGQELPDTVMAMVQTRLEAVDPEARRLLRAASVFGRVFWRGGVQALLGGARDAGRFDRWYDVLVKRELVDRRPSCRFPGEVELSFRHQLVCDAAYASLTAEDRRLGHRLAGAWLEAAGEGDTAVLAEHFGRGGELARAAAAMQRGAEQALGGHDFEEAILRAGRAIALGAESGELHLLAAEAHRWLGRFDEARRAAERAALELPSGTRAWFAAVEELLAALGRLGRSDEALAWIERATVPSDARSAQLRALCCGARLLFQAGDFRRGDALLARITASEHDGIAPRALAEAHRLRGARARHAGDVAGDLDGYLAALACLERAGDEREACNACVSVGFAYIELGNHAAAERELSRALAAAERMGLGAVGVRARQNLALVHAARGDVVRARQLATAVAEEAVAQGNLTFEGWTRIYLARIAYQRGDAGDALAEASRALELTQHATPARAGAAAAAARALVLLGRSREALARAREAAAVLDALGGIEEFEALVRVALCESLLATGNEAEAALAITAARHRLAELAARIPDPALRDSFLHAVPDNARLVEIVRERAA